MAGRAFYYTRLRLHRPVTFINPFSLLPFILLEGVLHFIKKSIDAAINALFQLFNNDMLQIDNQSFMNSTQ